MNLHLYSIDPFIYLYLNTQVIQISSGHPKELSKLLRSSSWGLVGKIANKLLGQWKLVYSGTLYKHLSRSISLASFFFFLLLSVNFPQMIFTGRQLFIKWALQ